MRIQFSLYRIRILIHGIYNRSRTREANTNNQCFVKICQRNKIRLSNAMYSSSSTIVIMMIMLMMIMLDLKQEMLQMMKAMEKRQKRAELRQDVAEKRIETAIAEIVSEHNATAASTTQDVGDLKSMMAMMMQQQHALVQQQSTTMQMLQGDDRRVKPKVEAQNGQPAQ
jgi:hypothetical protein